MRIGELRRQFVEVFREEMEKDGFFPYKGSFFKIDLENKWMMYVSVGTMAGGYVFRNFFDIVPFTYGFHMSVEDLKDAMSHEFELFDRKLHPNDPLLKDDFYTFDEESMQIALQIYQRDIRQFTQNVHSFSDSVIRSETVSRLLNGYVQLQLWLQIITHAYLHDFDSLDGLFQEMIAYRKDELLRIENEIIRIQKEIAAGNLRDREFLSHPRGPLAQAESLKIEIARVRNLYALYKKGDYTIFIEAAEKNIKISEEYAQKIMKLAARYNKRYL